MLNPFRKWSRGVEVSEVTLLVLPFVQISLKPAEDSTGQSSVVPSVSAQGLNFPQNKVNLAIKSDGSEGLVQNGDLRIDFAFIRPSSFDSNHLPSFELAKWQLLSGEIELYANEVLWILGRYENMSNRVLHKVPMTFSSLPFLGQLEGFAFAPKSNDGEYPSKNELRAVSRLSTGVMLDYLNPHTTAALHCFCRVSSPNNKSKNMDFTNYKSEALPKVIEQWYRNWQVRRHVIYQEYANRITHDFVTSYNNDEVEMFLDRYHHPDIVSSSIGDASREIILQRMKYCRRECGRLEPLKLREIVNDSSAHQHFDAWYDTKSSNGDQIHLTFRFFHTHYDDMKMVALDIVRARVNGKWENLGLG